MNRTNAFRLQGYESLDGICKFLHGVQKWAAIDRFQQRQPLCMEEDMLFVVNDKLPTWSFVTSPDRGSLTWIISQKETIKSRQK